MCYKCLFCFLFRSEDPKLGVFILNRLMSKNYHRFLRENVQFLVKNQFLLIKEESGEPSCSDV